MKHYITICMALVLSCCILFQNTASAVSVTSTWSTGYSTSQARAILINQYTVDYEYEDSQGQTQITPFGNYNLAVYEINFNVRCNFNVADAYLNGFSSGTYTYTPAALSGWTLSAVDSHYTQNNIEGIYSMDVGTRSGSTGVSSTIRVFANNYWSMTSATNYELGYYTIRYTYKYTATSSNVPDPSEYITVTVSASNNGDRMNASTEPQIQGFAAEVLEAINNGEFNQTLDEAKDFLDSIDNALGQLYALDNTAYTNVLTALNTSTGWQNYIAQTVDQIYAKLLDLYSTLQSCDQSLLAIALDTDNIDTNVGTINSNVATIKSYLNSIKSYTNSLKTYMSTFPTYSSNMLQYFQELLDQLQANQTDTDNMQSAAASLEDQINNVNNYSQPNVNYMLTQAENIMTDGTSGMNLIATIINESWIVQILLVVVSLGFVGYLLYGKGV